MPRDRSGDRRVPGSGNPAIPLLLEAAAGESKSFAIFGDDGTCVRDYVHVTDLADAHVNGVRALLDGAESTALNLGTGRGWSVRELVASVRDVTGCNIPVPVGAPRPGDPPVLIADASRARHQLAWRPSYSNLSSHVHACLGCAGKTWKRMQKQTVQTALHSLDPAVQFTKPPLRRYRKTLIFCVFRPATVMVALDAQLQCNPIAGSREVVEGDHVGANPKADGIARACCYASDVGRWRRSASEYRSRRRLSYGAEFSRAAGEPLVLSHRSRDTAQVLVRARCGSAGTTGSRAGCIRRLGGHGSTSS